MDSEWVIPVCVNKLNGWLGVGQALACDLSDSILLEPNTLVTSIHLLADIQPYLIQVTEVKGYRLFDRLSLQSFTEVCSVQIGRENCVRTG